MASEIKTIAVCDDSELKDGQMSVDLSFFVRKPRKLIGIPIHRKQVDFGQDGKVLLSRLGGKVHATSAYCTHYGAPLMSKCKAIVHGLQPLTSNPLLRGYA